MSDFERIFSIERHPSIEKKMEPVKCITIVNESPKIPMHLEMPILEAEIAKGKKKDSGRAIKKGSKR